MLMFERKNNCHMLTFRDISYIETLNRQQKEI